MGSGSQVACLIEPSPVLPDQNTYPFPVCSAPIMYLHSANQIQSLARTNQPRVKRGSTHCRGEGWNKSSALFVLRPDRQHEGDRRHRHVSSLVVPFGLLRSRDPRLGLKRRLVIARDFLDKLDDTPPKLRL